MKENYHEEKKKRMKERKNTNKNNAIAVVIKGKNEKVISKRTFLTADSRFCFSIRN